MNLIASLLIAVSVALGAVAATTAYSPRLTAIDPQQELLTLNAPAGMQPVAPEDVNRPYIRPQPIVRRGATLDEETLALLRDAGVERVRVREFDWARWDKAWLFGLAVLGLLTGAILIRSERRRSLEAIMQAQAQAGKQVASPHALLTGAVEELRSLQRDLKSMPSDAARLQAILRRLTLIQQEKFEPFISARPAIIGRMGMAGYAQLMDRFAAAERQVNRAWSAAADKVLVEANICIDQAITPLEEAVSHLQ